MMKINRMAPKNSKRALVYLVTLSLLLSLTTAALSQSTTANVLGVAADPNGATVSDAKITIRNVQTNATRSVTTDGEGRFFIGELAPGEYEVAAEHQGFRKELRQGIVLTVGREAVVNFSLQVGAVTDQVIVTGDAPMVKTNTSGICG